MKASFGSRLAAYIIDFLIVSLIVSIICYALPKNDNSARQELDELTNELLENKISTDEYLSRYRNLLYQNQKSDIIQNGVNLVIIVAYFVIFQYMNKGQTLGKKLLHTRVVDNETSEPIPIAKGLLRTIIIISIVSLLLSVSLINIIKQGTYMNIYITIGVIETTLMLLSSIFVLYRKDGRGIHDMVANTKVIKEEVK